MRYVAPHLEVDSVEQITDLLARKYQNYAGAIAVRAAARTFPLFLGAFTKNGEIEKRILLPTIHRVFVGLTGAMTDEFESRWYQKASRLPDLSAVRDGFSEWENAQRAIEQALDAWRIQPNVNLSMSLAFSLGAFHSGAREYSFSKAPYSRFIQADFSNVDHASPAEISKLPLWIDGAPERVSREWVHLKARLRDASADFSFWANWYSRCLMGDIDDVERLKEIACIDRSIWSAGANAVATEIEMKSIATREVEVPNLENPPGYGAFKEDIPEHQPDLQAEMIERAIEWARPHALADFYYDEATHSMHMVRFRDDLGDEDLQTMLAQNWSEHRQIVSHAVNDLIKDLSQSKKNVPQSFMADLTRYSQEIRNVEPLPGRLWWLGKLLSHANKSEDISDALGDYLSTKLSAFIDLHRSMEISYLAGTMTRMASKGTLSLDGVPSDVENRLSETFDQIKKDQGAEFPSMPDELPNTVLAQLRDLRRLYDQLELISNAAERDVKRRQIETLYASPVGNVLQYMARALNYTIGAENDRIGVWLSLMSLAVGLFSLTVAQ